MIMTTSTEGATRRFYGQSAGLLGILVAISALLHVGYIYFTTAFIEAGQLSEYKSMLGFSVLSTILVIPIIRVGFRTARQRPSASASTTDKVSRIALCVLVSLYVAGLFIINIGMYL